MVEYHPISERDQSRLHQFGEKVFLGRLLGYVLIAERIWKGDVWAADIEKLVNSDATEIRARRLNAKEVVNAEKE